MNKKTWITIIAILAVVVLLGCYRFFMQDARVENMDQQRQQQEIEQDLQNMYGQEYQQQYQDDLQNLVAGDVTQAYQETNGEAGFIVPDENL